MKRRMMFALLCALLFAFQPVRALAAEEEWISSKYIVEEQDGEVQLSGKAAWSSSAVKQEKMYLNGYRFTAEIPALPNMDWYAFIFGPARDNYVNSGGVISLLFCPRGDNMELSLMHSSFKRLSPVTIPQSADDLYVIEAEVNEAGIKFTVNGSVLESDSDLFNYKSLSRAISHSVAANAGANYQDLEFTLRLFDFHPGMAGEGVDEIVYGSMITGEDARISALSGTYREVPGETGSKGKLIAGIVLVAVGALTLVGAAVLLFFVWRRGHGKS